MRRNPGSSGFPPITLRLAFAAAVLLGCSDEGAQAERSGFDDAEPENALVGSTANTPPSISLQRTS